MEVRDFVSFYMGILSGMCLNYSIMLIDSKCIRLYIYVFKGKGSVEVRLYKYFLCE